MMDNYPYYNNIMRKLDISELTQQHLVPWIHCEFIIYLLIFSNCSILIESIEVNISIISII